MNNNFFQALYSATASAHKKQCNRFVPSTADRVLDAPGLMNDYCKNNSSLFSFSGCEALRLSASLCTVFKLLKIFQI